MTPEKRLRRLERGLPAPACPVCSGPGRVELYEVLEGDPEPPAPGPCPACGKPADRITQVIFLMPGNGREGADVTPQGGAGATETGP
jgi:hypothetical protein